MKVILYLSITANGMIANERDEVDFVSKNSWKGYQKAVDWADCIIIGRKTYELMPGSEFNQRKKYIVITHQKDLPRKTEKVVFSNNPPSVLIENLAKEKVKQVLISGGSQINSLFMKAGLIDEIYLDIEPIILGKGIKLFADAEFEAKLKLIGIKKLSKDEVQLHYKVKK